MESNKEYWVIGCIYTDTTFVTPANGKKEKYYGPYKRYEKAYDKWRELSWREVDKCYSKYRIEEVVNE